MDFKDQYNYESRNINLFNDITYVKKINKNLNNE